MIRTKETAGIIFGDIHKIIFDERLREAYISTDKDVVFDYGNTPKDERVEMRLAWFTSGESFASQVERMKNFMDMLMTGEYGQKIAIVTHNGCFRTLECIYNNMSFEDAIRLKRTENGGIKRLLITDDWDQTQASFSS